jgi:uncharacterized protein (TIRG00374 family)
MSVILLIAAIITICIAHILRVRRWELLVEVYEKPYKRNLLQSLSWGYLVNSFVPFKIGDLLRAFLSGRKMKNGKTLGLSTVIVDRYLDVVCVGLVFLTLMVVRNGDSTIANSVEFYLIASVLLILATILAVVFKVWIKKGIKIFAGVFNPIIETKLLRFAWALISNFKDIIEKINKIKLLILTICMWSCYLASYLMINGYNSPPLAA